MAPPDTISTELMLRLSAAQTAALKELAERLDRSPASLTKMAGELLDDAINAKLQSLPAKNELYRQFHEELGVAFSEPMGNCTCGHTHDRLNNCDGSCIMRV